MNATLIDIPGLTINQQAVGLEDSTDKAYTLNISDGNNKIQIEICFGKITNIIVNGKKGNCKHY